MPLTFILIPTIVIGLVAWLVAWIHTRRSGRDSPRAEIERLRNHAAWLEQRLDTARRERWDRDMILALSDQLGAACSELARARTRQRRRAQTSLR